MKKLLRVLLLSFAFIGVFAASTANTYANSFGYTIGTNVDVEIEQVNLGSKTRIYRYGDQVPSDIELSPQDRDSSYSIFIVDNVVKYGSDEYTFIEINNIQMPLIVGTNVDPKQFVVDIGSTLVIYRYGDQVPSDIELSPQDRDSSYSIFIVDNVVKYASDEYTFIDIDYSDSLR